MANPMIDKVSKSGETEPTPSNMEWLDPISNIYGKRWFRYVRTGDELFYLSKAITTDKKLMRQNFYLVHCNYFCVTSLMEYVPAEVAVLEFNFIEGVRKIYHTIVNPGKIPLGYAADAKEHSEEVHGITMPPSDLGEKNMLNVIKAIKSMVKDNFCSDSKNPPLFTFKDNVLPSMHILNDHTLQNGHEPDFIVYPVERMFYWAKKRATEYSGKGPGFMDEACAEKELNRDCYRFVASLACEFHQKSQFKFPACSKSIVTRLAYTICDHCCLHLGINVVPGKHVYSKNRRAVSSAELKTVDIFFEEDNGTSDQAGATSASARNPVVPSSLWRPVSTFSREIEREAYLRRRSGITIRNRDTEDDLSAVFRKMNVNAIDFDMFDTSSESDDYYEEEPSTDGDTSDGAALPDGEPFHEDEMKNLYPDESEPLAGASASAINVEKERQAYLKSRKWTKSDQRDLELAQRRERLRAYDIPPAEFNMFDFDYAVLHEGFREADYFFESNYNMYSDDEEEQRKLENDRRYFPTIEEELREYRERENRRLRNLQRNRRREREARDAEDAFGEEPYLDFGAQSEDEDTRRDRDAPATAESHE